MEELKNIEVISYDWGGGHDIPIIFDTNVLNYLLIPEAEEQINKLIQIYKENFKKIKCEVYPTISSVSIYECLQGNNQHVYLDLFKKLKCFDVNIDTQYMASQMKNFYAKHGITINNVPDLYIGATSYLTASGIITANHSDFPELFFEEIVAKNIQWKEKNRTKGVMLYLLRPEALKPIKNGFKYSFGGIKFKEK